MEIINDIDEIEHRLCLVLYNFMTYYFSDPLLQNRSNTSIYMVVTKDPAFIRSAEVIHEYCKNFSFEKHISTINGVGGWEGPNPMHSIPMALSFFEFIVNFDANLKKLKLKDIIKSKNDIYDIFFNTKEYMLKYYPNKQYHECYLEFGITGRNFYGFIEYNMSYVLDSSFATKVFEHKQQIKSNSQVLLTTQQEKEQREHEEDLEIARRKFNQKMYLKKMEEEYAKNNVSPREKEIA